MYCTVRARIVSLAFSSNPLGRNSSERKLVDALIDVSMLSAVIVFPLLTPLVTSNPIIGQCMYVVAGGNGAAPALVADCSRAMLAAVSTNAPIFPATASSLLDVSAKDCGK